MLRVPDIFPSMLNIQTLEIFSVFPVFLEKKKEEEICKKVVGQERSLASQFTATY